MRRLSPVLLLASLLGPVAVAEAPALDLVVCAPGYPGDTESAAPTMDALAAAVTQAAGWPAGRLRAEYHATLEGGLAALSGGDAALALVPLPFYAEFGVALGLDPQLEVVAAAGESEAWSLVARRGALADAAALDGWELAGLPVYAPRFVREVVLREWGALPASVELNPGGRLLAELRRAAAGERVALLLDRAQAAALATLPFRGDLEIVARSPELPGSLLCGVGARPGPAAREALAAAFGGLHESAAHRELLDTMRVARFRPLSPAVRAQVRRVLRTPVE